MLFITVVEMVVSATSPPLVLLTEVTLEVLVVIFALESAKRVLKCTSSV